ncbi:hypothetical protein [Luteitalea sp.]|uniref:hypothetical protein n=1 Tax=Luteitalea sp. TaxID=2004800 RepID=UPI0025C46291|nr:hypothetical protein [Luteitalea sp.]
MDPILEEMRRVKSISEIREARYRAWLDHLAIQLARLEDLEQAQTAKKSARVA